MSNHQTPHYSVIDLEYQQNEGLAQLSLFIHAVNLEDMPLDQQVQSSCGHKSHRKDHSRRMKRLLSVHVCLRLRTKDSWNNPPITMPLPLCSQPYQRLNPSNPS